MLKDDVVRAVDDARAILQREGILVEVPVTKRVKQVHARGTPQGYDDTIVNMVMAITAFDEKEIDGDRVFASDLKGVLFPIDGDVGVNDLVEFVGKLYRIERNAPTLIGTAVLINTLTLRPT